MYKNGTAIDMIDTLFGTSVGYKGNRPLKGGE
jgi:hypothetical protein